MGMLDPMIQEFQHEAASTRKTLERIPNDKLDYKPHEKSFTLRALASHLAEIPGWGATTMVDDEYVIDPDTYVPFAAGSAAELVSTFDKGAAAMIEAMKNAPDSTLMEPWSLKMKDEVVFTLPRIAVMRSMIMNHLIHHRAQLGVYLRLLDVAVPAVYGPSADEKS